MGEINVGLHADNCVYTCRSKQKQCYTAGMYKYNDVRNIILINAHHNTVNSQLLLSHFTHANNLQYLAWRVLMGLHRKFIMSFMLVGHTKFAPNRRTFVSSLNDVAEVVNTSADVNMAQLVGTQNGEPVVTVYNWVTFLGILGLCHT